MKYKIQNNSGVGKAFKIFGGLHEVKVNTTAIVDLEFELNDEQIDAYRRSDVIITRFDRKAIAEQERAEAAKAKAEAEEAARREAARIAAEDEARRQEEEAAKAKAERDALIARAAELKVEHDAGIADDALKALIAEADAKANPPTGK